MRKNLVLLIALCFGLFGSLAVVPLLKAQAAQAPQAPSQPPSAGAQKLAAVAKQLNLTPEQKAKLLPILEAEAPKLKAIKENTSLSPMQKLDQLRAVHQQVDPQVQGILTAQQYAQWEEMRRMEVMKVLQQRRAAQQ